jgi:hypothetical protein
MNYKAAKVITFVFSFLLLIAAVTEIFNYATSKKYDATVTDVTAIREMSKGNSNPLYKDYYEEDAIISYHGKTDKVTIKERFKYQLPKANDTVKILVSRKGKMTEKKAEYMVKTFLTAIFSLFLLYLNIKTPENKYLEKRG